MLLAEHELRTFQVNMSTPLAFSGVRVALFCLIYRFYFIVLFLLAIMLSVVPQFVVCDFSLVFSKRFRGVFNRTKYVGTIASCFNGTSIIPTKDKHLREMH